VRDALAAVPWIDANQIHPRQNVISRDQADEHPTPQSDYGGWVDVGVTSLKDIDFVEIDRVLRMGRSGRLFTSVALLRIDPATGSGLLANAGHPFPILLHEGKTFEVAGSGLPLGQGPKRTYLDVPVEIPKGGVLVLASDGLFEGPDRFDVPYGFERPRTVLESTSLWRRPSESIIEALLADWRLHVGEGPPSDDTTILVVKRPLF